MAEWVGGWVGTESGKMITMKIMEETSRTCPFGDPCCPCQDGDSCHYVDLPGSPAMAPPADYPGGPLILAEPTGFPAEGAWIP